MDAAENEPLDSDAAARRPPGPAHAIGPRIRPARLAALAGLAAALIGLGLGTAALLHVPAPAPRPHQTLQEITVSSPAALIPLSDSEVFGLLDQRPDYGGLGDPKRLASCLNGLAYPTNTRVLGAQPVDIDGRAGVLLVLPADRPDTVIALAVAPNCSSVDTGLLADTTVRRP
jgi:hypothetical protein